MAEVAVALFAQPAPGGQLSQLVPLGLAVLALVAVLTWPARCVVRRGRPAPDGPLLNEQTARDPDGQGRSWAAHLRLRFERARARWFGAEARSREEVALLEGLAAALEAGLPTEHAVSVVLEVHDRGRGRAWEPLSLAASRGQALAPAWARVARWTASPTVASVARAWVVASATGAPLAEAVRSSASAARERHRLRQAVRTATAGARATVLVLSLLPLAGLGLAAAIGVGPVRLYADPVALAAALVGLTLLGLGHLVVQRMVGRVLKGLA